MKSFKSFLNEEIMPFAQIEKGVVGIDNEPVRDAINNHLTAVTERGFTTPYIALESVRKVLSSFHIFIPATNFMDGNSGYEAFKISQFGSKSGMTNDGDMVVNATSPFYVYFEYQSNELGGFDVFCQVINDEELNEILNDVESDLNDDDEETEEELDEEVEQLDEISDKVKSEYIKAAEKDKSHAERQATHSEYTAKHTQDPKKKEAFKSEADWLKSIVAKRSRGIKLAKK